MALIEGTSGVKALVVEYDFAVQGGATAGGKTLYPVNGSEGSVPAGSVVTGGVIDVLTAFAGATATVAFALEGAGDILATTAITGLTLNAKLDVVPDSTGTTAVKTSAARSVVMTIATAALTAGKARVTLFYV